MKIGLRTPSLKKSLSARTKGRLTREIRKATIPGYGKGISYIKNPKKYVYNKVYQKTTFSFWDLLRVCPMIAVVVIILYFIF